MIIIITTTTTTSSTTTTTTTTTTSSTTTTVLTFAVDVSKGSRATTTGAGRVEGLGGMI